MAIRISPVVRNLLAVWGALSLVLIAAAIVVVAYYVTIGIRPRDDRATKRDVRFVLNWPGLGEERIEAVVHSHESLGGLSGDHFVAYAIRVTSVSESELLSNGRWLRGDRADHLTTEAIQFVSEARHDAPWLPTAEDILTDKYYIWRWRIEVGERVSAASLIFVRTSDRMIFYASLQV